MTEKTVQEIFEKHASAPDLNERMILTEDEVRLTVLKETGELSEVFPEIVRNILKAESRIDLFNGYLKNRKSLNIPMSQIYYIDFIRTTMLNTLNYMNDNYNTVHQWFRDQMPKADLEEMIADMVEAMTLPTGLPPHMRGLNFNELNLEFAFFNFALAGILGEERARRYGVEYNKCIKFMEQCQNDAKMLAKIKGLKES